MDVGENMRPRQQIEEILEFHEDTKNYKNFKSWYHDFYTKLTEAGAHESEGVDASLRRLTPDQINAIHKSLPK